jgi:hypothetical protein
MGKIFEGIDDKTAAWIREQRIFFVATAPLGRDGHINCSPKGGDSFNVIGPTTVAYQDLTGSGAETIAHLRENGRIVIMFCAFEGPAKIVRLHGIGEVVATSHTDFVSLSSYFPENPGTRAIIRIKVTRVSDSCGYGVPFFDFRGQRNSLNKWAHEQGTRRLEEYRKSKNKESIDGLPALDDAEP